MDIDIYENFNLIETVSLSKALWGRVLLIEYLDEIQETESIIPVGLEDAGEILERIDLSIHRKALVTCFSALLVSISKLERTDENIDDINSLLHIITFINAEINTHMALDI